MPLVLEVVGADLLDQADPPALLGQVDQGPDPLVADRLQGQVELVAAVAAERVEQVAGEAGRVDPDQRGRDRLEVAHDDRDRLVARLVLDPVADDPPPAVAGGQLGLGHPVDQLLAAAPVADQHLDRDDRQAELGGDLVELLAAGDVDPVEDLDQDAGRR